MRKLTLFAVLLAALFSAETLCAQYAGQNVSVTRAGTLADKAPFVMSGNIIRMVGRENYIFRDDSGEILLRIKHDKWRGVLVSPADRIEISGAIRKDGNNPAYADVESIRIVVAGSAPPALSHAHPSRILNADNLNRPLTRRYIERYSSPAGIAWLNTVIRNGSLYFPFIEEEISRRGLPAELIFLPFVESDYINSAKSRAGAVGLWQFMANSVGNSIQISDFIDERRDFRKATSAALQKLYDNYRTLGNWDMALAAYNAGLGAAMRAVRRTGSRNYWEISGRNEFVGETVHYVPKFLAVSYILSNPDIYGVDYRRRETTEWTVLRPGRQVSLDMIAYETGADAALLRRLNQELLHGITPPDWNYELVVPSAQAELIAGVLEREETHFLSYRRHRTAYGETLAGLSDLYGVSAGEIARYNPAVAARNLHALVIGEVLIIPVL